jgi:hypothetical protein
MTGVTRVRDRGHRPCGARFSLRSVTIWNNFKQEPNIRKLKRAPRGGCYNLVPGI